MNFFHPEMSLVMKPLFSGLLTNKIYGEQSQAESVSRYVQKYGKHAEPTVTGVYLDVLECYIMPILRKRVPVAYCLNKISTTK
jgi:hypothetical protein